jgi:hypothetical protein
MKTKLIFIAFLLIIILSLFLQSCSKDTTGKSLLSVSIALDKINFFGKNDFKIMKQELDNNELLGKVGDNYESVTSLENHIINIKIRGINQQIKTIEVLKSTKETKEMLDLTLEMLNFVKEKYKTDYLKIAKLIDAKGNESEVEKLLNNFEKKEIPKLKDIYNKLSKVIKPIAKKYN